MHKFQWINENSIQEDQGRLTIHAPAKTDIFNFGFQLDEQGVPDESTFSAPVYYTEIAGDFVLRVKVSLEFQSDYDACALMVMKDRLTYGKLCFEKSDFDTVAVVSVVTNVRSDDANGVNVEADSIWLQMARVGHYFVFHYSLDGKRFDLTRLFWMEAHEPLKVGLIAQSPTGEGGPRHFEHLSIEHRTLSHLRKGI